MTNYNSLLSNGSTGWHSGNAQITYSFLGSNIPDYYSLYDSNGDEANDSYIIAEYNGQADEIVGINADVSMNSVQTAAALHAVNAWNEVANVNLVVATNSSSSGGSSGGTSGTPITGDGTLVSGLGGPAGFGEIEVPRNDDSYTSYSLEPVFENGLNFFGTTYTSFYVNTNGSISFGRGVSQYTPTAITSGGTPMIAPFWADVDTRTNGAPDSNPIYVDFDTEHDVVTITWSGVGYFNHHADKLNDFQLQLYDRGNGDFDIVFRYQNIEWTTGDASGGTGGLGGRPAHMGWTAGNGNDYYELPQSGNEAEILELENTPGNTGITGLWVWQVRNGQVSVGDITFGAYSAYSSDGTDEGRPLLPDDENARPQREIFGFVSALPGSNSLGNPGPEGDLWINNNNPYMPNPQIGDEGWVTFLHEMGHALGLTHPDNDPFTSNNQWTVMSYNPHPSAGIDPGDESGLDYYWPITPMLYDIQAMQVLYGANMATRNTDTTYFGPARPGTEQAFAMDDGGLIEGTDAPMIMTIWDGGGNDWISAENQSDSVYIDLRPGHFSTIGQVENNIAIAEGVDGTRAQSAWIENAMGGQGNDVIIGNRLSNSILGGRGDDVIHGNEGDDTLLQGNEGRDQIFGGDGDDFIRGGKDDDILLQGNQGRDIILGDLGNDFIRGGKGDDILLQGNQGNDTIMGDLGNDYIRGGKDNDTLYGGEGNDTLYGDLGDDVLLQGNQGRDIIYGGPGADFIRGGKDDDILLQGNQGNDTILGDLGDDLIRGGKGNDTLYGGEGDDIIWGDLGNDTIYGGPGYDTARYAGSSWDYTVVNYGNGHWTVTHHPTGDVDTLYEIESITFDSIDIIV